MLWTAIAAMQHSDPNLLFVVYSGDVDASKEEIIAKAKVSIERTVRRGSLMWEGSHGSPLLSTHQASISCS